MLFIEIKIDKKAYRQEKKDKFIRIKQQCLSFIFINFDTIKYFVKAIFIDQIFHLLFALKYTVHPHVLNDCHQK